MEKPDISIVQLGKEKRGEYLFKDLLHSSLEIAFQARKIHLKYFKNPVNIQNKLDLSLVSEADQESERVIRGYLKERFPKIDILGEELGLESHERRGHKNSTRWLIDPLDGTTNYIHGYPFFCSSIALEVEGKVVLGVVDCALLNRTYWCVEGHGAFCNNQRLKVSQEKSLKESLVATGFLTYGGQSLNQQMSVFQKITEASRGIRRCGSAALELCFVAEGALDGYWEFGLNPWDTGAGSLMVQEASGRVTNTKDESFDPNMKSIVTSNGFIHQQLLDLISIS